MGAAGECLQHRVRFGVIRRLAENTPPQNHRGIRREYRMRRPALRDDTAPRYLSLHPRDTLDIVTGRFARQSIFIHIGRQHSEFHADLFEQLAPARRLRSQIYLGWGSHFRKPVNSVRRILRSAAPASQ